MPTRWIHNSGSRARAAAPTRTTLRFASLRAALRAACASGLLLLALGSAPAPALAQGLKLPVSGTVISVNPELRTLQLGADTFYVPESVTGFEALAPGATVLIHYKSAKGRSVVTKIEAAEPE